MRTAVKWSVATLVDCHVTKKPVNYEYKYCCTDQTALIII